MPAGYLHYDVFTDRPFSGNQLAVFLDARGLTADTMQAIAQEMNFSECTFVLPPDTPGTDVRVRIFTPATELPMAGHPTIGTAFALAEAGVVAAQQARVVFELNIGPVPVDLEWGADRLRSATMTQLPPRFSAAVARRDLVARAIRLEEQDLVAHVPAQVVSCGAPFLLVPLVDDAAVDRAVPDSAALAELRARARVETPVFLFAFSSPARIYARMFGAGLGISEDPATGSACGPAGSYVLHHGLLSAADARRIVVHQGVAMGRPSLIHVAVGGTRDAITDVRVGGTAVLVGRGELELA